MDTIHTLIHANQSLKPLASIFEGFFPESSVHFVNKTTCFITHPISEEGQSTENLYELLISDMEMPLSMVVFPSVVMDLFPLKFLAEAFKLLPKYYYDYEQFLLNVIKQSPTNQSTIKHSLSNALPQPYIQNALGLASANMNISVAAKRLYIHRNTLIYRIEAIKQKTGIDIKQFNGLMIFTLLFA